MSRPLLRFLLDAGGVLRHINLRHHAGMSTNISMISQSSGTFFMQRFERGKISFTLAGARGSRSSTTTRRILNILIS